MSNASSVLPATMGAECSRGGRRALMANRSIGRGWRVESDHLARVARNRANATPALNRVVIESGKNRVFSYLLLRLDPDHQESDYGPVIPKALKQSIFELRVVMSDRVVMKYYQHERIARIDLHALAKDDSRWGEFGFASVR